MPNRRKKQAAPHGGPEGTRPRLVAEFPDADGATVVPRRPARCDTVTLPLIAPEAGLPDREGKVGSWGAEEPAT